MQGFHHQTLSLLREEGIRQPRSLDRLEKWAEQNSFTIPAAFAEWARLDDGSLLTKYSNDDWFWIDDPEVIVTPDGMRGLRFHSENQNNFDRIVMLNQGDDPPVQTAWIGHPPWVVNTEKFSDAVFAQIFDWQYWLEFRADDPDYKEIAYTGDIRLKTDRCLQFLRSHFKEGVSTRWIVDGDEFIEYRFAKSAIERVTVSWTAGGPTIIRISGEGKCVPNLEADLLDSFDPEDILPQQFNSILWAADFLDSRIRNGWHSQLKHACLKCPTQSAIDRLAVCQRHCTIRDRVRDIRFPLDERRFTIGGLEWGVVISFVQKDDDWWVVESISDQPA